MEIKALQSFIQDFEGFSLKTFNL